MQYIKYASNKYSQNGEDGILLKIFEKLDTLLNDQKVCVEFGSWDGIYLSNTFQFVENGWKCIAIEGSKKRFKELQNTSKKYNNIVPILKFIDANPNSKNSLNQVLIENEVKEDFELLSIDVDGKDLEIWDAYKGRPKIVVIEINSYIRPTIEQRFNGFNHGSSFKSTLKVGLKKGYTLVCHTGNMIFARNDLVPFLDLDKEDILDPNRLFQDKWINTPKPNKLIEKTYSLFIKKFFN